jgi:hypothetical protein
MSLVPRSCQKLAFRFLWPYKVLQHVVVAAYKLELPTHAWIHNVVHVSQLKKHAPLNASVSFDIAVIRLDDDLVPAGWI